MASSLLRVSGILSVTQFWPDDTSDADTTKIAVATPRYLDEFVESDGFFTAWPEEIVFRGKPSRVTGPGGADVSW